MPKKVFFLFALFLILLLATYKSNPSLSGHNGRVSSYVLAIAHNSKIENYFVGYGFAYQNDLGKTIKSDFSKTPIFSNLIIKLFSIGDNKRDILINSRYFFIIIFFITAVGTFYFLYYIFENWKLAFSSTIFTFSTYYFQYYKDMICSTNFNLLAVLLCLYGIHIYINKRIKTGIFLIFISINIGYGYSQIPILVAWFIYELITKNKKFISQSLLILISAITYTAIYLFFHIWIESLSTDKNIFETDIVISALNRLNIKSFEVLKSLTYSDYFIIMTERFFHSFSIRGFATTRLLPLYGLLFFTITAIIKYSRNKGKLTLRVFNVHQKRMLFCGVFGILLWMMPLKNIFAPHRYMSVYYFLIIAIIIHFILNYNFETTGSYNFLIIASLLFFGLTNYYSSHFNSTKNLKQLEELSKISNIITQENINLVAFKPNWYQVVPGLGEGIWFFFNDFTFKLTQDSNYLISNEKPVPGYVNLVGKNEKLFLFKKL